jgi:hypothetical protein
MANEILDTQTKNTPKINIIFMKKFLVRLYKKYAIIKLIPAWLLGKLDKHLDEAVSAIVLNWDISREQ